MGFGMYLMTTLYYNRVTYKTKWEVEQRIEELKENIERYKEAIGNLVLITEPKKFIPDEDTDPLRWLTNEYKEYMELIEEDQYELFKLELLYNNWDKCHDDNDNCIIPPKEVEAWWDSAFCGGDFLKEVYPDGTPANNG
jgi:hypothetical protein